MRTTLIGALVGTSFMLAVAQAQSVGEPVYPQPRYLPAQNLPAQSELITHFAPSNNGPHTMAIVDPQRKVLAVYHIDANTGAASLKSVRNLSWDLQMTQFNSDSPSPQDIRSGLEQQ